MDQHIQLAHGGGGRLSAELIRKEILPRFGSGPLKNLPDASRFPAPRKDLIFTTDSYVVQPVIFPGGNIGSLAIHGTVNDISVSGGRPLWISLGLILEEGLPLKTLRIILDTIMDSAAKCGVQVATGDTKVVARGQCDGIYINTSGIGEAIDGFDLSRERLSPGDSIIVSGTIGDHGMAVLAAREGINIENGPASDSAPVSRLVGSITESAPKIKFMRDPTRGGLAAVLNEIVEESRFGAMLESRCIPVSPGSNSVSEMLGIDLLNVACEGRMILICDSSETEGILKTWRSMPEGYGTAEIGKITSENRGRVVLRTITGGSRLVDVPSGELLPRIC